MSRKYDLSFVTYSGLPDLDGDDRLTMSILEERGYTVAAHVWNDPSVDWNEVELCVLRSTWDYHLHLELFQSWIAQVSDRLLNPSALVNWNLNKGYLLVLEKRGIAIAPSEFVAYDSRSEVADLANRRGWNCIIVKPAVGLATFGVKRFALPEQTAEAQQHMEMLLKSGDVIVQQFMDSVAEYGERALVFFDGEFSHAVRKEAFQQLAEAGKAGETAATATNEEIEFGRHALELLPEVPLYARVDIVQNAPSATVLMELELIEPSLFLAFCPQAPSRFADAIERRLAFK